MSDSLIIVYDDREQVPNELQGIVGQRRFGEILFKGRELHAQVREACVGANVKSAITWLHLRSSDDVQNLRVMLKHAPAGSKALVIAARAGFTDLAVVGPLLQRLDYADSDFCDRLYQPLLAFFADAHALGSNAEFAQVPLHLQLQPWLLFDLLESFTPLDLSLVDQFLNYFSGVTAARHFNEIQFDQYFYTKRSSDKQKIEAEYRFYALAPEALKPWLVQPFEFKDEGETASYKMMRYYLSDVALPWVHGAFDQTRFIALIDRIWMFLRQRPLKHFEQSEALCDALYLEKLRQRSTTFLASKPGQKINQLAISSDANLALEVLQARFEKLYTKHRAQLASKHAAIGHNDLCFSNILYDSTRSILKLIDPKGARTEAELWTHSWYDLAKLSHSILGDYDFINSNLAKIVVGDSGRLQLNIDLPTSYPQLKRVFRERLSANGIEPALLRITEASLFLSMLPLHVDQPKKVLGFMLRAQQILDEIEATKGMS